MKIGILTFHWAANHGAVLQAFATQKYLETQHFAEDVAVINYFPKNRTYSFKKACKPHLPSVMYGRVKMAMKDKKIDVFRKRLNLSKRYYTNEELIENPPDCDVLLCGSDQIWNPSYLRYGEGHIAPVYFLNFGKKNCKKIALSVSFGCVKYPEELQGIISGHIKNFDAISVRENTGLEILRSMGENRGVLTADPTSLLSGQEYAELCEHVKRESTEIGCGVLRKQTRKAKKLLKACCRNKSVKKMKNLSVEAWLATIRDSKLVVTNSFHCVMLSLKMHTPFVVLLESGTYAKMNDRMFTLLDFFGLSDRIIKTEEEAENIPSLPPIHWDTVEEKMNEYAKTLIEFLKENIPADGKI